MREWVEDRLHDTEIGDADTFALRRAASLGAHEVQLRYDRIEEEITQMIRAYNEVRYKENPDDE